MIADRPVLAIIPARGGSKGVPGKNMRIVHGKPLIEWTIQAAKASKYIDRIVVSSDDDAIIDAARTAGADVPFKRPADLATDTATSIDVALHALDLLPGFQVVVLLQPTSPLRLSMDIDAALELCQRTDSPACASVTEAEQSPYWMFRVGERGRLKPVLADGPAVSRRQDLPDVYVLNGAIYVADCTWLRQTRSFLGPETVGYVMPESRSIDIDGPADLAAAESALVGRG